MSSVAPAVLLVDDDASFARALVSYGEARGCDMAVVHTLERAASMLHSMAMPDLIILDLGLPDGCGLGLIEHAPADTTERTVVVTGNPCAESAQRAWRFPIMDYLVKPLGQRRIDELFRRAGANARSRMAGGLHGSPGDTLLGMSRRMQEVRNAIRLIAPYDDTVLLSGPSGTGKELAAQAVHALSGRRGRFVAVNCGATSAELLGSHLFGHERGSFTGAVRDHRGYFEQAQGGTLFLDEITEMPRALQPYLLRVLETGMVTPLGAMTPRRVDVRVVAACNSDPLRCVEHGRLRSDLYYRLAQFPIRMPSLGERVGDIAYLAEEFLDALNDCYGTARQFSPDALGALQRRPWPGNVRELKHTVRRAYLLAERDTITPANLGDADAISADGRDTESSATLESIERQAIYAALARHDENKTLAARQLGISVKTIYNKLERYRGRDGR
jgi:DNA-binding NtrC family response regulator